MRYPESLLKLTRALSRLPGIGPKTAQRLALHLAFHKEEAEALAEALEGLKRVRACRECGNLAEGELCPICQDEDRDRSLLAVVESVADLYALERSGEFRGLYHVLGGALNPLEGIGPKELNLEGLFRRLEGGQRQRHGEDERQPGCDAGRLAASAERGKSGVDHAVATEREQ